MINFNKEILKSYNSLVLEEDSHIIIDSDKEIVLYCDFIKSSNYTLEVKDNVKAKVVELLVLNHNVDIKKTVKCGKNASLEIVSFEYTNGGKKSINVQTYLLEGSYINNKKVGVYNSLFESSNDTYLNGEYAEVEATNAFVNSCGLIVNINENVHHKVNDTTSLLNNYGICNNKSTININTNGLVVKDAKRSNIRQKSKGILIDLESTISANPWLQIDEFDCLANHGAGIGAIDEEDLYYLMSRGLTKSNSEKLIIGGFVNPIYEALPEGEIKDYVIKVVNKYL